MAASALTVLAATPIANAQVVAGAAIENVARVNFEIAGARRTVSSNIAVIKAAERLDITLIQTRPPIIDGDANVTIGATLTNTGNGQEAFVVTGTIAPDGASTGPLAIDVDGDGRFGAGDTPLVDGRTPVLAPGQVLSLVLVVPASAGTEPVTLTAVAATGAGTPGTAFDGQGDGGADAVVGSTGARASVSIPLVGTNVSVVSLEKRQRVAAPDGSARAVSGATITYTMVARFTGAVRGATLEDPVPAGTSFVPGSIRLDGATLSDAADGDAGQIAAGQVRVALGDVAQPGERTISFQVTIQ